MGGVGTGCGNDGVSQGGSPGATWTGLELSNGVDHGAQLAGCGCKRHVTRAGRA